MGRGGKPEGESQEAKQEKGTDLQKGKARIPLDGERRGGWNTLIVGPASDERDAQKRWTVV